MLHDQVRRDNPRLTTRREGGHAPTRVVMSRTLDLPVVSVDTGSTLVLMVHIISTIITAYLHQV